VIDTGKGIHPEFLSEIFQRFRQEDASTTRRFGGLGLGLAIVKNLTELHGGTVRVSSEGEDKGATFVVELPIALAHPRHAPFGRGSGVSGAPQPRQEHADLSGIKVLAVDDDDDAQSLIARVLRDCQAVVATASSAAEGLEVFKSFRPHVVLSDIGMPDQDGYDFIRVIRGLRFDEGRGTPAAALTAFARPEDRTRALLAGFQVHVSKPIEPSELIAVVTSLAKVSLEPRAPGN
jgi:CheY-like chemotaxis protein